MLHRRRRASLRAWYVNSPNNAKARHDGPAAGMRLTADTATARGRSGEGCGTLSPRSDVRIGGRWENFQREL